MSTAGHRRPAYLVYKMFWKILDWVFPPICGGGCGQMGTRWCETCKNQVFKISGAICPKCGEPLSFANEATCPKCLANPPAFQALRSCTLYKGTLRNAHHQLKYQRDIGMGDPLSKHLIEYYNETQWDIDLVTAVPLSKERLRERGYNQVSFLALPFAYAIGKPYLANALSRTRNTRSQVELSAVERRKNVEGAFVANAKIVNGKNILLIDDVTTTGSTISACAKALQQAGASAVFGLTLARALPQADADDQPKTSQSFNGGKNGS